MNTIPLFHALLDKYLEKKSHVLSLGCRSLPHSSSAVGSVVGGGRGSPADAAVRDLEVMRSPTDGFFFAEGAGALTKVKLRTCRGIAWTDGEDRGRRKGLAGPEATKAPCGVHFIILKRKNDTD